MDRLLPTTDEIAAPRFLCSNSTQLAYFGEAIHRAGTRIGPRVQQNYELILLIEGDAQVELGSKNFRLETGQMCLFRSGLSQAIHFTERRKTHHVRCSTVNARLVTGALAEACQAASAMVPLTQRCASLVEIGLSLPRIASERAQGLIESLALSTLQEFLFDDSCRGSSSPLEPGPLRRAIEWVDRAGDNAIDIPSLSREAGVSATQLLRLFKSHLGTTPMHYVWETRARRGIQLLRETELSVSEIAWRCGFQTPFHFSRWVKKVAGSAPALLRRRVRGTS